MRNLIGKIFVLTLVAFLLFVFVLFGFDPKDAKFFHFFVFYASMFVFLGGLFFLVSVFVKKIVFKKEIVYYNFLLRSGLLSLFLVALVLFNQIGYFSFTPIMVLSFFIIVLELIFSKKPNERH